MTREAIEKFRREMIQIAKKRYGFLIDENWLTDSRVIDLQHTEGDARTAVAYCAYAYDW